MFSQSFFVPRPLIFFYDKPHICRTAYYRDILLGPGAVLRRVGGPGIALTRHRVPVFGFFNHWCSIQFGSWVLVIRAVEPAVRAKQRGSLVQKGDFIEETVGIAQREDIIQHGDLDQRKGEICGCPFSWGVIYGDRSVRCWWDIACLLVWLSFWPGFACLG